MWRPLDGRPIKHVARGNRTAVDDLRAIDGADDEAGDVVFAVGVEARHLRGLAAEQRAAVVVAGLREALDDLLRDVRRQPAGREVIEKEQRRRALHEDVVDAVIDEIGADGAVPVRHERDLELGADAVGARHEHRLLERGGVELEQAAERSDVGQDAGRERGFGQTLDAADGFVARIDVDTGGFVIHESRGSGSWVSGLSGSDHQKSSLVISCSHSFLVGEPSGAAQ